MDFQMDMKELKEGVYIAALKGSLNADTVFSFEQKVLPVLVGSVKAIVLEMSGLKYIDSTALAAVLRARKTAEESGGRLFVAGLSPRINNIFKVIHILPEENIFNGLDDMKVHLGTL